MESPVPQANDGWWSEPISAKSSPARHTPESTTVSRQTIDDTNSLFRPVTATSELTAASIIRQEPQEPAEEHFNVIVDDDDATDLDRKSASRDRKSLSIVLLIAMVMLLAVGLSLMVILG